MSSSSILSHLTTHGFYVEKQLLHQGVSRTTVQRLKQLCLQKACPIFNQDFEKHDGKRRQVRLNSNTKYVQQLLRPVRHWLRENFPRSFVAACTESSWVAIYSFRGCAAQKLHRDFPPFELHSDQGFPMGLLLALEDDTTLEIVPFEQEVQKEVRTLRLQCGDLLVFHGSLIHGGSCYKKRDNVRLHAYMDHNMVPRARNKTWKGL